MATAPDGPDTQDILSRKSPDSTGNKLTESHRLRARRRLFVLPKSARILAAAGMIAAGCAELFYRRGENEHGGHHVESGHHFDPHEHHAYQREVHGSIVLGGMQQHIDSLSDEDRAAILHTPEEMQNAPAVACIDERVAYAGVAYRNAGSGILNPDAQEGFDPACPENVKFNAQLYFKQGIVTITSHDECGAAHLAQLKKEGLAPEQYDAMTENERAAFERRKRQTVESYSQAVAAALADLYKNNGDTKRAQQVGYVHIATLHGPKGAHNALAVNVDTTGFLKPVRHVGAAGEHLGGSENMVASFTITDAATGGKTPKTAALAAKIALGGHGMGEVFTPQHPFVIAIWFSGKRPYGLYQQILEEIRAQFPNKYDQARIRIEFCSADSLANKN